jgi:acetolactate synthase I/II/III large subunit
VVEMRLMTGGDLVAEALAREGVDHFIGILGGQILPLFDAVGRDPRLRLVVPRSEAAGAMIADGYARASGKVAVNISTVGAGAIYSAAGTANAWGDHVPVFSISPQVQSWKMYPAQESLQGCYQADMFAGVSRWNCVAYNWKRIPSLVQRALREALSGEKGPVHMDIPVDIFFESHPVTDRRMKRLFPPPGSTRFSGSYFPEADSAVDAVNILREAKRPLIVAGLSVLREGAWGALEGLASHLSAPVTLTAGGLSSLPAGNAAYIGPLGHAALPSLDEALGEADALLMVGTTTAEQEEILDRVDRSRVKLIQTSPEAELLGALGPVDAAMAGDAAAICEVLEEGVESEPGEKGRWLESCRSSFEASVESLRDDARGSGPGAAVRAFGEALRPEDLVVLDGPASFYWGSVLCPAGRNNTRYLSSGLKGVGYGLPMAMGVKLARLRERVFALCDTEALMHHIRELDTARREGIAVTVFVVGEAFDWKAVAEGFGLMGSRATTPGELMSAIEESGSGGTAALIDLTGFEG